MTTLAVEVLVSVEWVLEGCIAGELAILLAATALHHPHHLWALLAQV
jgi:hypothetical protein